MLIASGDPINIILVIVWVAGCTFCAWLAIYAYYRWRKYPDDSISYRIATWAKARQERFLLGFCLGMVVGVATGIILGMFTGHWFWPVELDQPPDPKIKIIGTPDVPPLDMKLSRQ